jgi:hypothetical protein
MLTSDLVVTDSGSATKPGALGAKTFALVAALINDKTLRRIAATALTTPQELSIQHTLSGTGFKQRCRTATRYDFRRLDTDTSLTGGIIPSFSVYNVIDRPVQSNGYITQAHIETGIGSLIDVFTVAGQLAKLLNLES